MHDHFHRNFCRRPFSRTEGKEMTTKKEFSEKNRFKMSNFEEGYLHHLKHYSFVIDLVPPLRSWPLWCCFLFRVSLSTVPICFRLWYYWHFLSRDWPRSRCQSLEPFSCDALSRRFFVLFSSVRWIGKTDAVPNSKTNNGLLGSIRQQMFVINHRLGRKTLIILTFGKALSPRAGRDWMLDRERLVPSFENRTVSLFLFSLFSSMGSRFPSREKSTGHFKKAAFSATGLG